MTLIQSFTKMTDASSLYRGTVLRFFKERRLDTMATMATLIKSAGFP